MHTYNKLVVKDFACKVRLYKTIRLQRAPCKIVESVTHVRVRVCMCVRVRRRHLIARRRYQNRKGSLKGVKESVTLVKSCNAGDAIGQKKWGLDATFNFQKTLSWPSERTRPLNFVSSRISAWLPLYYNWQRLCLIQEQLSIPHTNNKLTINKARKLPSPVSPAVASPDRTIIPEFRVWFSHLMSETRKTIRKLSQYKNTKQSVTYETKMQLTDTRNRRYLRSADVTNWSSRIKHYVHCSSKAWCFGSRESLVNYVYLGPYTYICIYI